MPIEKNDQSGTFNNLFALIEQRVAQFPTVPRGDKLMILICY